MNQKAFTVDEYHDSLGQTERPIFDVSVSGFIVPAHPELGAFQRSYRDAVCALAKSRGISLSDMQTSVAEQGKSKVESFMDLLKKADSVELSCSPLLSDWSTDSVTGVPSNEIVSFSWVDEESATYQLALTEEGVANGTWIGDKFVCEDSEGDEVQITLNAHIAITYGPCPVEQRASLNVHGEVAEHAEVLPGATSLEIREVMMQDIVGDYDVPEQVPEWKWVESNACFAHVQNGTSGIWEFGLNLACEMKDIPERLRPVILKAQADGMAYLMFHQGT